MDNNSYVTFIELSDELGMDRSNFRQYALKNGFKPFEVRSNKNHLKVLAISSEDAELIRKLRNNQGYSTDPKRSGVISVESKGCFYIIQLIPDVQPNRVKFGFSSDVKYRLKAHRTSAPTASLLRFWFSKSSWEMAAIDSITRTDCRSISNEVYDCESLDSLIERAETFFNLMPGQENEVSSD